MTNSRFLFAATLVLLVTAPSSYAATSAGIDTPQGVSTLPLAIGGSEVMLLEKTGTTASVTVHGDVYGDAFYYNSDERLKRNIETIKGLDIVQGLRGVSFEWKKDGKPSAGFIAQDVEKVLPSAVHTKADGFKTVDYNQLLAPMAEAIKELKRENERLSAEVEGLKRQLEEKK